MTFTLAQRNILHTAFCNGLSYFEGYGLDVRWDVDAYNRTKARLQASATEYVTSEDVLIAMIHNRDILYVHDIEDDDEEIVGKFSEDSILNNWDKIPLHNISNIVNEDDDVNDADIILQIVAFGDIVYG